MSACSVHRLLQNTFHSDHIWSLKFENVDSDDLDIDLVLHNGTGSIGIFYGGFQFRWLKIKEIHAYFDKAY